MSPCTTVALPAQHLLGEGIVWCDRAQVLWWTDIPRCMLWRYRPADGERKSWAMPERLCCLALCEADAWLLLGLASRLAFFHPASETLRPICEVETGQPVRVNDGACDRQGRFVFGTLHEPADGGPKQPLAGFFRLDHDLMLERLALPKVKELLAKFPLSMEQHTIVPQEC